MDYTRYIILSSDTKQAEYYFKRVKAILNPVVKIADIIFDELMLINGTKIRFATSLEYYTNLKNNYPNATVMRDDKFEEKLMKYMKTVKDIKEVVKCQDC